MGYETVTLDPLGSGDSSPVFRTFESEVMSAMAVIKDVLQRVDSLVLVGHSMGAATAVAARAEMGLEDCSVWCLAPLCRLGDMALGFLSESDVERLHREGRTFRHGLELRIGMIAHAEQAWVRHQASVDMIWLGSEDRYTRHVDMSAIPRERVIVTPGSDHNFSNETGVAWLIESTTKTLAEADGTPPR